MSVDDKAGTGRVSDATSSRGLAGKRDYVRSLEQRRDDESLTLLVECLCDESWYLRELTEAALLRMGERCAPTLMPLLQQGLWYSRACAARVLGLIGYAPAALALLRLTEDSVETVVRDAYAALAALGARGGSARIAWELHRLAPERRHERMLRLALTDRGLSQRLERWLQAEELMAQDDPDALRDDAPRVRAIEEGVEWDRITEPPPIKPAAPSSPGVDASAR